MICGMCPPARAPETALDWATRIKVAEGAARGLVHLHQNENIVHGNLTASNILLDTRGTAITAAISDFGLSRLMTPAANANVVATAGSLGYRAPELTKLKKATTKSDVYSFGIVLLELLTGKSCRCHFHVILQIQKKVLNTSVNFSNSLSFTQ